MSIEHVQEGFDHLSEQVGQFGEGIIGVSNEEQFASLAPRVLYAERLATELAGVLLQMCTDLQEYGKTLAPYDGEGQKCVDLAGYATEVIAGADAASRIPDDITRMGEFTAGAFRQALEGYGKGFPRLARSLEGAANELNKIGSYLPRDAETIEERVQERTADIQAQIRRGKASI